jgi:predicted nucleic acid-binding Zn ribbon protein
MFQDLKSLLPKSIKRSGLGRAVEAAQVLKEYETILKEILPARAMDKIKPLYVKDRVLTVASLSSVIAQELGFKEAELVRKINAVFGQNVIEKIRYIT